MFDDANLERLMSLARLIRYYILACTTRAGSGHPTSALSAVELMTGLLFGGIFRYDLNNPDHPNNDRLIFSKGHASPLFYALWAAAGKLTEADLMTYRRFGSPLEGHPTVAFPYVDAATGSLGQGLSIGLGLALNAKYLDKLPYRTYVLLGDSEMAEGSQWEAIQLAAHYGCDNLVGILDVNRLGQCGETMYGHDLAAYERRIAAFGWATFVIDGHSFPEVIEAYRNALRVADKPTMVIAKTVKGKGFSMLENQDGWHGKALARDDFERALKEMGDIDASIRGAIVPPAHLRPQKSVPGKADAMGYRVGELMPTRNAFGKALKRIYPAFPEMVSVDGEVSNSTQAQLFKEECPDRFFEMYVAEQNMVGVALGFACRKKIPFVSTFSAFMSRAYDQIRMSQYSDANIKFVGSHAGVSIGEDGPSQMGLEDLAFFRTILHGVVLYPSDAVSCEKLVEAAAKYYGIVYLRTTRGALPVIYDSSEDFPIGGSKVLRQSSQDIATVVAAGITLHEALHANDQLKEQGVWVRVIDLYSIKPVDAETLHRAAEQTRAIITVEDHYAEGGLGEAVRSAFEKCPVPIYSLAVRHKPKSGKPHELLDFEEISHKAIVAQVHRLRASLIGG
ncbi:transketolase [Desulfoferrobacter suflitae]|uniref:transketolase n=1 Tax=Desulfoferrobacter suflitae TaxID=2865782 RepID=UPI002164DF7F|nr:transketolase [Desulfoferrobacter suflitae]MCK8600319.1 transketolase [Desulfoferrobacter suflitae]